MRNGVGGIGCWGGKQAKIADNTLRGLALESPPGQFVTGIFGDSFPTGSSFGSGPELRISGNELEEIGPAVFPGEIFGIAIGDGVANWEVSANLVQRGVEGVTSWTALEVGLPARALMLALTEGLRAELGVAPSSERFTVGYGAGAAVGNRLIGSGKSAVRIVMDDADCTFSNNRIDFVRVTPPDRTGLTGARVHLAPGSGGSLIVSSNSITRGSAREDCSVQGADVSTSVVTFAVIGNLTDCLIVTSGVLLPENWRSVNQLRAPLGPPGGGEIVTRALR